LNFFLHFFSIYFACGFGSKFLTLAVWVQPLGFVAHFH